VHRIEDVDFEGYPARALCSPGDELVATFATQIGMVGCSLRHEGVELLGQRGGLARYEAQGSTMGIPFLHPWANRLSAYQYEVAGKRIHLDRDSPLIHLDPNRLPIHGVLAACPHWRVAEADADEDHAVLSATLDYAAHAELLEAFPFPHELRMTVRLDPRSLRISTTLTATGDTPVPVSFGFHPYLQLPDVARADWYVELPVRTRLLLDERFIPTGATEPVEIAPGPLGERTFDDGYCDLAEPRTFVLAGGGRRIELEFLSGYDFAQVYAPPDQDVICFEPMTAATNALVAGGPGLTLVRPGERYEAAFEVRVSRH
jgi:aldose 1-epimerase